MNMKMTRVPAMTGILVLILSTFGFADFQYKQQSKITGGTLLSMSKSLGAFSKDMRKLDEPQITTTSLKGNRLRHEPSTGEIQIIDLDARRFIYIDPAKKTYSTMTFEEFKAAMQRAMERAKEQQSKAMKEKNANVKLTPKLDMQKTGATRTVLNLQAQEVKMKIEMQMESDDPKMKQSGQSMSWTLNSDMWVASSISGYSQMKDFYTKMAKELDWLPGTMGGAMSMSPMMGPAMEEFRKNAVKVEGMPVLQYVSMGTAGTMGAQGQGDAAAAQQRQAQAQQSNDGSASNPQEALAKGLGGMFGGFGKKKKEQQAAATPTNPNNPPPPTSTGSMMDMTIEVLSYSTDSLDKALFDVPAGYTQVQRDPDEVFGGKKK